MPRKRKDQALAWLPPRVYATKTAYALHPRSGGSLTLAPIDARPSQVWAAYERVMTESTRMTLGKVADMYFASPEFKRLAKTTRTDYPRYAATLAPVMWDMDPEAVHITHIRQYLDKKGETAPILANRHISFLQTIFKWARERGYRLGDNPCTGVTKFPETPRSRYISDEEYNLVLCLAKKNRRARYIAPFMELAYLCRLRKNEVQMMTKDKLTDDGIFVERGKGSENEVTEWSDRLREAVEDAFRINELSESPFLIHDKDGNPINLSTFDSAWKRLMRKAREGGLDESYTFHDIKAKGVTDHDDHASGHRSEKMKAVYQRKPKKVKPTK